MLPKTIIKNVIQETRLYKQRLISAVIIIAALVLILIVRLFYLQIIDNRVYSTLSKQNQLALLPIEPNRGLIYDRNGILLAENIPAFSLDIIPGYVKDLDNTINSLKQIINISDEEINQFHKAIKQHRRFEPVPLKLKLNQIEMAHFSVNQHQYPGALIQARMIRHYPLGPTTASVLGYVGRINIQDLQRIDEINYRATNFIGKVGIEKHFENELHGQVGFRQVEIDANGRILRTDKIYNPIPGNNIYLTIDSKLQQAAEKALGKERGAAVAIDPNTGEILALVSHPSYDPNIFVTGVTAKQYHDLQNSADKPMYNRAIRGQFPFASTIKPFVSLALLDEKYLTPKTTFYDEGSFQIPNTKHVYHCWKRTGHGLVNITKALIVSCDTYFYKIANKFGIKHIDDILERFGFGRKTNIEIDEELPGLIPSPQWKMRTLGEHWYAGDTVISIIGQGFMLTTPIQLAQGVTTIANRGLHYQPHLLLALQTPNKAITRQKIITREPVMLQNPKVWQTVINAMQRIITSSNPWGTGRLRFGIHPKYQVAVKTGGAQVYSYSNRDENQSGETNIPKNLRDHSLFIAFAPVDHPQIAVATVAEHSPIAGTIARKILDYYLITENHLDNKA